MVLGTCDNSFPSRQIYERLHGVVNCNSCPLLYEKKLSHLTLLPSCLPPPPRDVFTIFM